MKSKTGGTFLEEGEAVEGIRAHSRLLKDAQR
jgi:hypothetical protein